MAPLIYFWKNQQVITWSDEFNKIYRFLEMHQLFNIHSVDTAYNDPNRRYGYYTEYGNWRTTSLEVISKEFRLQLLLLGVET